MFKPGKVSVRKTRHVIAYSELWHASTWLLEVGRAEPRGSQCQFLSSILLAAFSFEAYLNHAGPQVLPCWPSLERLSPLAKFELLRDLLKVDLGGKGQRPLQTLFELFRLRNTVAHAKSEYLELAEERDNNYKLDVILEEVPLANWEKLIRTDSFAKRVMEDVKEVMKKLHKARPKPKESLFEVDGGEFLATTTIPIPRSKPI